jgi:hypothetical protein
MLSSDAVSPVPGTHTHSLSLSAQLNAPVHPAPRHLGKSAGGKSSEIPLFIFHLIKENRRRVWNILSRDSFPNFLEFKKRRWAHTHTRETFDCIERVSILCNATRLVMKFIDCVLSTFWEFFSGIHCYTKQHRFYIIFKSSFKPLYRGKGSCVIILYFYCIKETWLKKLRETCNQFALNFLFY